MEPAEAQSRVILSTADLQLFALAVTFKLGGLTIPAFAYTILLPHNLLPLSVPFPNPKGLRILASTFLGHMRKTQDTLWLQERHV